jgi:peptidoglycan/LPS O-acetylase OafA/YrhL
VTASSVRDPAPRPESGFSGYRPDIDGLRAVAVLSVVGYHAFPGALTGGFVGVDVFFVISGFLISTLIYRGLEDGSFSFADFYSRRIRRIFPAVLVVLAACLAFGWFTLLAVEYRQVGKHVAGGAAFVSNFVLWRESGYFDNEAETKPLLHLWSLGIEEQFYIAWPLLIWLAWKARLSLVAIAVVVAILSFALNLATYRSDAVGVFYSPLTRFWELLAGSVLAWVLLRRPAGAVSGTGRVAEALSFAGAACIAAGLILITGARPFPGIWAVLPVLGAALVIAAGPNAWLNRVVLSAPLLVWFGLISYPLYAWHWPVLSFARIVEGETPAVMIRVAAVLASIALAWLTYRLFERPMRFGGRPAAKAIALAALMSLAGIAGFAAYRADGIESRTFATLYKHIGEAKRDWKYPHGLMAVERHGVAVHANSAEAARVLLFGDSHVQQFGPRIVHLTAQGTMPPAMFLTGGGCPAIPFVYEDKHPWCRDFVERFERVLARSPEVSTILIGGCWNCYFINQARPVPLPGDTYHMYYEKDGVRASFRAEAGTRLALASLGQFLQKLAKTHTVYLLLDNPGGAFFDPADMLKNRLVSSSWDRVSETLPPSAEQVRLNEELRQLGLAAGARVIDQIPVICPGGACSRFDRSGRPIYMNSTHMRPFFVIESAHHLDITWNR